MRKMAMMRTEIMTQMAATRLTKSKAEVDDVNSKLKQRARKLRPSLVRAESRATDVPCDWYLFDATVEVVEACKSMQNADPVKHRIRSEALLDTGREFWQYRERERKGVLEVRELQSREAVADNGEILLQQATERVKALPPIMRYTMELVTLITQHR